MIIFTLLIGSALAQNIPNPVLTPGVVRPEVTKEIICATAWGKDVRHVTSAMKREVFNNYQIKCTPFMNGWVPCSTWEVDHFISRELGGADDVKNLWPQLLKGDYNARMKDRLENYLHKQVCTNKLMLIEAQNLLRNDWRKAYDQLFRVKP